MSKVAESKPCQFCGNTVSWISVEDKNLKPDTYYMVKCHDGVWIPILLNIDMQWVLGKNFLPIEAFSNLDKLLIPYPQ